MVGAEIRLLKGMTWTLTKAIAVVKSEGIMIKWRKPIKVTLPWGLAAQNSGKSGGELGPCIHICLDNGHNLTSSSFD